MNRSHTSQEKHKIVIDSGIPIKYIQAYLDTIAVNSSPLHYKGDDWEVILIPKSSDGPNNKSSINIPRTDMYFLGEKDIIEEVVRKYRLEFLSAGG